MGPTCDRRRFVEQLLVATAGLSLAQVSCSRIEQKPLPPPNERINVALIGAGSYGRKHVPLWAAQKNVVISHVCDPDTERGGAMVELVHKYQKLAPAYERDLRTLFENKDIDVVAIVTPHHWHAVAAVWAMQAGKDVYLEKPVSHNVREGRVLVEAARKYGRICQAGTHRRSFPNFEAAAKFVREGKLGTPRLSRCITYMPREPIGPSGKFTAPATVDYDLWAGPAKKGPLTRERFHYDWHWFWDTGNGALGNNGVHRIDLSRWLFDLKGLGDGAISYGGRFGERDAGETPNTQITLQTFGDICVVQEVRGLPTKPYRTGCVNGVYFEGTDGIIVDANNKVMVYDLQGKPVHEFSAGQPKKEAHFENFLKAATSRKHTDLNCDIEEGHLSSALCHIANISHQLGQEVSRSELKNALSKLKVSQKAGDTFARTQTHLNENGITGPVTLGPWLEVDSQTETFKNNPEANALLERKSYRKGFELPKLT